MKVRGEALGFSQGAICPCTWHAIPLLTCLLVKKTSLRRAGTGVVVSARFSSSKARVQSSVQQKGTVFLVKFVMGLQILA